MSGPLSIYRKGDHFIVLTLQGIVQTALEGELGSFTPITSIYPQDWIQTLLNSTPKQQLLLIGELLSENRKGGNMKDKKKGTKKPAPKSTKKK